MNALLVLLAPYLAPPPRVVLAHVEADRVSRFDSELYAERMIEAPPGDPDPLLDADGRIATPRKVPPLLPGEPGTVGTPWAWWVLRNRPKP